MSYLYGLRNFAGLKMKGKKSICSAESAGKSKREVTNSESKKNSSAVWVTCGPQLRKIAYIWDEDQGIETFHLWF